MTTLCLIEGTSVEHLKNHSPQEVKVGLFQVVIFNSFVFSLADEVFILSTYSYILLLFVEHSVQLISYHHGEDQLGLLNQEHPTAIKKRVHEKIYRKDGTFRTAIALESLPFS